MFKELVMQIFLRIITLLILKDCLRIIFILPINNKELKQITKAIEITVWKEMKARIIVKPNWLRVMPIIQIKEALSLTTLPRWVLEEEKASSSQLSKWK